MESRQVNANNRSNVKTLAAVIGGSAVIATVALSVAIDQEQRGPVTAQGSTMATGVTSTQTMPSTVPATSMAVPSLKGPAPLPSEEQSAK